MNLLIAMGLHLLEREKVFSNFVNQHLFFEFYNEKKKEFVIIIERISLKQLVLYCYGC